MLLCRQTKTWGQSAPLKHLFGNPGTLWVLIFAKLQSKENTLLLHCPHLPKIKSKKRDTIKFSYKKFVQVLHDIFWQSFTWLPWIKFTKWEGYQPKTNANFNVEYSETLQITGYTRWWLQAPFLPSSLFQFCCPLSLHLQFWGDFESDQMYIFRWTFSSI